MLNRASGRLQREAFQLTMCVGRPGWYGFAARQGMDSLKDTFSFPKHREILNDDFYDDGATNQHVKDDVYMGRNQGDYENQD